MASPPNVWNYDKPPVLPLIGKIGDLANNLYAANIPGAKDGISRFFSLYLYILRNLDVPAETLRQRIVSHGAPVFTPVQMKNVVEQIRAQKNTPFAQRLLRLSPQYGGAEPTAAKPTNSVVANGAVEPVDDNPSRTKFWDIFIRNLLYKIARYIPPAFDSLTPFIFALYGLEQIEILGPLLATFFDSITLGLPTIGNLLGDTVSRFVSLAPIPYAGIVGDLAAYFISLLFIMTSSVMSMSRKQFGTAFTVGVGAVPLIGDQVSDAALLFEKQVERYDYNKKKILASLEAISPHTADVVEYWTPNKDELIKSGPPVLFDPDEALLDILEKAVGEYGPEATMAILDDPSLLPPGAEKLLRTAALPNAGKPLPSLANLSASLPAVPTTPIVPGAGNKALKNLSVSLPAVPTTPIVPGAGKALKSAAIRVVKKIGGRRRTRKHMRR